MGYWIVRLDRLRSIPARGVNYDSETRLIQKGVPIPRLVLGSAGWLESDGRVVGHLLDRESLLELFASLLEDEKTVVVGANLAQFDFTVIAAWFADLGIDIFPHLFEMFEQGRVYCILNAQVLDAIAEGTLGRDPRTGGKLTNPETGKPGSYSQSMVCDLVLDRKDAKANDEYRLRYGEFDGVPLELLPQAARDYPVDDVRNCHEVALAQIGYSPRVSAHHNFGPDGSCLDCASTRFSSQCLVRRPSQNLHDLSNQIYSAFCLHLGDIWGLRVDQSKVDVIEAHALKKRAAGIGPFITAGLLREDESENQAVIKRMIAVAYGATQECAVCAGTGRVPSAKQDSLRCSECKGRCQPWKGGGKINAPTVAECLTCANTGRVPHPVIKTTTCIAPDGETKTCDGTGLVLTEDVPRSDKEGISFSKDACFESGDEFLMSFGAFKEDAKDLKDYIPWLRRARLCTACGRSGVIKGKNPDPHADDCPALSGLWSGWRDIRMLLKSNPILETGRVSFRGYIMLLKRAPGYVDPETKQYIPSMRECFVPTGPSYATVSVPDDYVLQPGEFVVQGAA